MLHLRTLGLGPKAGQAERDFLAKTNQPIPPSLAGGNGGDAWRHHLRHVDEAPRRPPAAAAMPHQQLAPRRRRENFLEIRSARRDRFPQKILEIGAILGDFLVV